MKNNNLPSQIISLMMEQDFFSQWLGITIVSVGEGTCSIEMSVRKEMLNGFGISHGGIAFSVADSALAFASNSRNRKSLVINTAVSFTAPVHEGDVLQAVAEEISLTKRIGIYSVTVTTDAGSKVLIFTGTVFRKDELWFPEGE